MSTSDTARALAEELGRIAPEIDFAATDPDVANHLRLAASHGKAMGAGVNLARELGNLPGNVCTRSYLAESDIPLGSIEDQISALEGEGKTVMLVAVDGKAAGLITVADPVKASTPEAIRDLHAEGIVPRFNNIYYTYRGVSKYDQIT